MEPNNLESLIQQGQELLGRGDYQLALEIFEQALAIDPQSEYAWDNKGITLVELKEYERALFCFDQAIEINPLFSEAWNGKGEALYYLKEYEKSIECLDQSLQINPQSEWAWNNKGYALIELKEYKKALHCFDQAIEINPLFELVWKNKGNALSQLKEYKKALHCFDKELQINPQSEDTWYNKGNALSQLKEHEKALHCFNQTLQINPFFSEAWSAKGAILMDLKEYEKAVHCFEQAIEINPHFENAWHMKGIALHDLKQYKEALFCFEQAIEINPHFENAWHIKGLALYQLKEYKEAVKCFNLAIQINPLLESAWSDKGIVLCDCLFQYQEAISCFEKVLLLAKNQQFIAWRNKSVALSNSGYKIKAIKNLDVGLKSLRPEYSDYQEGMGELYFFKGNLEFGVAEMQSMPKERRYYREMAEDSYRSALDFFLFEPDPEGKYQAFPERHLEVCRDLIKIYRYTRPNQISEMIRQVDDLLARFLANPNYSASRKIAIQRKLANYQQLRIDDLIQSDKTIEALELAEQRKNDCLRWLFSIDNQKIINPQFAQIQTLLNPQTAIIYWHISPTAISTFILKHQQTPIVKTVLFQATNQTDNLQRFEKWLDQWLENYDDYCQQPKNQTKQPDYSNLSFELDSGGIRLNFGSKDKADHPWRQTMDNQIAELRDILKIKDICQDLDGITNLILIPHRYLHTLPLEILFPEQYIMTRLPSAKVGIDQQAFSPATNPAMLLVEQIGQNKGKKSQGNLTFAQIEAIALQQLYKIDHHLQGDINKEQVLENLLNPDINLFHFTGHAQHDSSNPSESALALNSGEQVTMIDIYQKINQCQQYYQLACLNGCETGITNREDLTDEFIGLASAFLPKTQYVISSLWRVDDQTSALLMMEFYRLLQVEKMNAIEALNQAKYWLRDLTNSKLADWYDQILMPLLPDETTQFHIQMESERLKESDIMETPYKHPYSWAAFIISGNF